MATRVYYIQIEPRPWDTCPNNINRMTGQEIKDLQTMGGSMGQMPEKVSLGKNHTVTMYKPLRGEGGHVIRALILRRYAPPGKGEIAWTVPDDRKVNSWDLNEPDPTDNGTRGT